MTPTEDRIVEYLRLNPGTNKAGLRRALGARGGLLSRSITRLRLTGRIYPPGTRILLSQSRAPQGHPYDQRIARLLRKEGPLTATEIAGRLANHGPTALDSGAHLRECRHAMTRLSRAGVVSPARALFLRGGG